MHLPTSLQIFPRQLLTAPPAPFVSQDVARWGQCGGKSSSHGQNSANPGLCCESGTTCQFENEWYWQCRPGESPFLTTLSV